MMDGGVPLEREQLRNAHGAWRADARQVVAHQVDDHQVLGAILGALGQRLAERGVVLRTDAARPRPLDRPRLDTPLRVDVQEALGRRAEHRGIRESRNAANGAGLRRRRRAIQRPTATPSSGASNRCDRLAWKMSPAKMYSRTRATASR